MHIRNYLIGIVLVFLCVSAEAQAVKDTNRSSKQPIYLLPDGSIFEIEKLDSLNEAWGEGRVALIHTKEDDDKGIVHMVRITDEFIQESKAQDDKRKEVFKTMLDKPAPDFSLTDLQGRQWSLKKLRGKIVVLNFWFTSCGPCILEMPELNELVGLYSSENVVFLGLTFNNAEQVKTFLKKRNFSYRLLPDSDGVDKKYKVSSWPTNIIIDKKGDIKMIVNSGPNIRQELQAVINSLK